MTTRTPFDEVYRGSEIGEDTVTQTLSDSRCERHPSVPLSQVDGGCSWCLAEEPFRELARHYEARVAAAGCARHPSESVEPDGWCSQCWAEAINDAQGIERGSTR